MNLTRKFLSVLIIILFSISSFSLGQTVTSNIALGQTISIESKVLNEAREIMIFTPNGYEQSKESYPVLYVLDGENNFFISTAIVNFLVRIQRIPKMIVIGIPNVARNRDFTPYTDQRQNFGGADNFISFLEEELVKFIDNNYRTQNYKILYGHSLCGMFSVYTLFTNPDLFNAHIATSPALMNYDEYVIDKVEEILVKGHNFTNQLYMSIGNEPAYFKSLDKISSLFIIHDPGINWTLEKYEDEDHGSIPLRTIADGLIFTFSDQLTDDIAMKGIDAIKNHFQDKSKNYGFYTKQITESTLNRIGYKLLQNGKNEKAIDVFKYNVELYPESANVYDSLGDGLAKIGKKKKALKNYKKAVSIGEKNNDINLPAYRRNVEKLKTYK